MAETGCLKDGHFKNLEISGNIIIDETIHPHHGPTPMLQTLDVSGPTTISEDLTVTGATALSNNLAVDDILATRYEIGPITTDTQPVPQHYLTPGYTFTPTTFGVAKLNPLVPMDSDPTTFSTGSGYLVDNLILNGVIREHSLAYIFQSTTFSGVPPRAGDIVYITVKGTPSAALGEQPLIISTTIYDVFNSAPSSSGLASTLTAIRFDHHLIDPTAVFDGPYWEHPWTIEQFALVKLSVTGNAAVSGDLVVGGGTNSLNSKLDVSGDTTLHDGYLHVEGQTVLTGVTCSALNVEAGPATVGTNLTVNGTLLAAGAATVGSTLVIGGPAQSLSALGGARLYVAGSATLGSDTGDNIQCNGTLLAAGAATVGTTLVIGGGTVDAGDTLKVSGNTSLVGNLDVGNAYFNRTLTVHGTLSVPSEILLQHKYMRFVTGAGCGLDYMTDYISMDHADLVDSNGVDLSPDTIYETTWTGSAVGGHALLHLPPAVPGVLVVMRFRYFESGTSGNNYGEIRFSTVPTNGDGGSTFAPQYIPGGRSPAVVALPGPDPPPIRHLPHDLKNDRDITGMLNIDLVVGHPDGVGTAATPLNSDTCTRLRMTKGSSNGQLNRGAEFSFYCNTDGQWLVSYVLSGYGNGQISSVGHRFFDHS
jgi:hypothetical protein